MDRRLFLMACALVGAAASAWPAATDAAPIRIVAAEKVYGDVTAQIGGEDVTVAGLISTPAQDPHQFEAAAAAARTLAGAEIVIENGMDYDPWVDRLLASSPAPHREVIVVADLLHRKPGANPHLWYDPNQQWIAAQLDAIDAALAGSGT